jgi:hypothetical protein
MAKFLDQLKLEGRVFVCLCQNEKCREQLGGMHIPCTGGICIFACQKCGTVSAFKNGMYGIEAKAVAQTRVPPASARPTP